MLSKEVDEEEGFVHWLQVLTSNYCFLTTCISLAAQSVKNLPAMQETWV